MIVSNGMMPHSGSEFSCWKWNLSSLGLYSWQFFNMSTFVNLLLKTSKSMSVLQDANGSSRSGTRTTNNKHKSICSNLYLQKQTSNATQENVHHQLSFQVTFTIPTSLLRLQLNIMCYSKFFKTNDIQSMHFLSWFCM